MPTMVRTKLAHANIKQTMSSEKIEADTKKMLGFNADLYTFCEASATLRKIVRASDLGHVIGDGAASQLVVAWDKSRYDKIRHKQRRVNLGRAKVQPHRYLLMVWLRDKRTGKIVVLIATHMIASGWTGKHWAGGVWDRWRRAQWWIHLTAMSASVRYWARKPGHVVYWAGDMNRPYNTFKNPPPFHQFFVKNGKTGYTVRTSGTHGSRTYDYTGVVSKTICVNPVSDSTPSLHSDHDAVVATSEQCV